MRGKLRGTILEYSIIGLITLVVALLLIPDAKPEAVDEGKAAVQIDEVAEAVAVQAEGKSPLENVSITIDAGHGGYDSGAVGRNTKVLEKDLNLKVALMVADILSEGGAKVALTRDGDYALCAADTPFGMLKKTDMAKRAEIIDENYTQILVSIHMNEDRSSASSGPQVFYQTGNEEGKELAQYLQLALTETLNPPKKRTVNDGDYFILRHGPPSVLVECGFLSNPTEEALLQTETYQKNLATAITKGITTYCADHSLIPLGPEQ